MDNMYGGLRDSDKWHASGHESPLQQCTAQVISLLQCASVVVFSRYLCSHQLHLAGQKATYSENEVLYKDIVGSHSSSTVYTEGYAWNVIRNCNMSVIVALEI